MRDQGEENNVVRGEVHENRVSQGYLVVVTDARTCMLAMSCWECEDRCCPENEQREASHRNTSFSRHGASETV